MKKVAIGSKNPVKIKAILLSGDDVAPNVACSKLHLEEIVDIIKAI